VERRENVGRKDRERTSKSGFDRGDFETIGFEVSSEKSRGKRGGVSGWSATVEKEIFKSVRGLHLLSSGDSKAKVRERKERGV